MTSFVATENLLHCSAVSGEIATPALPARTRRSKGLAAMLLAALVAALVVAADSVVDTYADDHLLVGWVSLWAVGFAALALFANAARSAGARLSTAIGSWAARRAQRRSDAYLFALASNDPRIMADIQAAIQRANAARQTMDQALGRAWLDRSPVGTLSAAYSGPRNAFRATPVTGLPTHLQYLPG